MDSAPEFPTHTKTEGREVIKYLEVETEFMAAADFYTHSPNAHIRSFAVAIIASHSNTDDSDAFIPYLAMNYFDRYFSTNQFQDVEDVASDAEKVCLVALCCLFISAKMRTKTFSIDQFLRDKSINFTHERIMEMELNILKVLHWRMQPVTAFLYLNYFYHYFKRLGGFKRRCIYEILIQAQGENKFVYYKPSQMAMSAFLAAAEIAYPSESKNLRTLVQMHVPSKLLVVFIQKEELSECVRALGDLCARKNIKIEEEIPILAKGKGEIEEITEEETQRLAKGKGKIEEITEEETQRLAKGKGEIEEISEEETPRLTRSKAVTSDTSSKERQTRLAKGKAVVLSETSVEETQRQPPKSKSEEEKKKLVKEDQEKIARVEAAIKLAMEKGKVEKGALVERSLFELEIVNEPEKLMNFELKWPSYDFLIE